MRHIPVLLKEALELIKPRSDGIYVDCTLGGGGHAEAILKQLEKKGRLIGIDQDEEALMAAKQRLKKYNSLCDFTRGNFKDLREILKTLKVQAVDAIFFDLGLSSLQLDSPERGFSFRFDAPLDMRFDRRNPLTAAGLISTLSKEKLKKILKNYSQEPRAGKIARLIVEGNKKQPLRTTGQLLNIIRKAVPFRPGGIHPATRTFQALRIAVNNELEVLKQGLLSGFEFLKPSGVMCVISYHSLEDRIVKKTFRDWSRTCRCPSDWPVCRCAGKSRAILLTKKVIIPSEEEIRDNPRSRSAKLRALKKI